jgi:hypothetical protein
MKLNYKSIFIKDLPENPLVKTIYIIGTKDFPWQAAFICPCGCKEVIQLSLLPDSRPSWRFWFNEKNQISLSPSVWRTIGCRSHFFVRNGRIYWAQSRWYQNFSFWRFF